MHRLESGPGPLRRGACAGCCRGSSLGVLGLAVLLPTTPAARAPRAARDDAKAGIAVIQVDGLIDPPNAELIRDSIRDANRGPTSLLVIKFASGGAVDVDPGPLVRAIRTLARPGRGLGRAVRRRRRRAIAALLATAAPVAAVVERLDDRSRATRCASTSPTPIPARTCDDMGALERRATAAAPPAVARWSSRKLSSTRGGAARRDEPGLPRGAGLPDARRLHREPRRHDGRRPRPGR